MNNFSAVGRGGVVNTFVNDYQAIGINPANLARGTTFISFSVLEGGVRANSRALKKNNYRFVLNFADLSVAEKAGLAEAFTSRDVLNVASDLNTVAFSVNLPGIGGFAISNRQRVFGRSSFSKNLSELAFLGENASVLDEVDYGDRIFLSQLFDASAIHTSRISEWNIAYGSKVVELPMLQIFAGVGYKYLQGLHYYEFSMQHGAITSYTTSTVLPIARDEASASGGRLILYDRTGSDGPIGHGHGVDLGVSAAIAEKINVSIAVTDIGNMRWDAHLRQGDDKGFMLPTENQAKENGDLWEYTFNFIESILDSAIGPSPAVKMETKLPTRLRTGIGMKLGKKVQVGLDYVMPLNNSPENLSNSFIGIGADVMPFRHLRVSTGLSTGAGEKFNLPLGLAFVSSAYEFGVSSRDVTAPFSNNEFGGSLAFGFLRFRIK